jgi:hypothetical protein
MELDPENLHQQIPYYLTADDRQVLIDELKAISRGSTAGYFLSPYRNSFREVVLQGDGWPGFQLRLLRTGEQRSVQGVVLSNSCDVDPGNPRVVPARVAFAPLVKLSAYERLLRNSSIGADKVSAKIASIKAQSVSSIFYLPAGGPLAEDHVVRLDDIHSMPVAAHEVAPNREKLFTLSNTGFYMLVFKLSVHFCRLQEKVNRRSNID